MDGSAFVSSKHDCISHPSNFKRGLEVLVPKGFFNQEHNHESIDIGSQLRLPVGCLGILMPLKQSIGSKRNYSTGWNGQS